MSAATAQAFLDDCAETAAGAGWLAGRRREALESFRRAGLPTRRQEAWKYTDMRMLTRLRYRPAAHAGRAPAGVDEGHRYGPGEFDEWLFVNGRLAAGPALDRLADGVRVRPLPEAARDPSADIEARLGRLAAEDARAFVALNTALMSDGAVIDVPDGVELRRPLHVLFVCAPDAGPIAVYPRNLIRIGANARATVIETYAGTDADYFTNTVTEIELGAGAALEHYKVQQEGANAAHVGCLAARLERDSRLESHSFALGALLARNDIDVRLAAEGAEAHLNGLYLAGGRQHVDHHTRIDHEEPRTRSREHYRGVLDGQARAVFNGKVVVHPQAQKTDAEQHNANLLLSAGAEVDTKPELEIYADDVKCSHGATVGRLDPDMLFYLCSRAIPEDTARALLTFAFAEDVIRPIRVRPVRDRLERGVAHRLPNSEVIREYLL